MHGLACARKIISVIDTLVYAWRNRRAQYRTKRNSKNCGELVISKKQKKVYKEFTCTVKYVVQRWSDIMRGNACSRAERVRIMLLFVSLFLVSRIIPNVAYCQSPPQTDPYVYILVWGEHPLLELSISTYQQDLEDSGFSVEIPQSFGNTPETIRQYLQTEMETHEIAGVVLIGDVPCANYEMEYANSTRIFPCDLYYMDLDGNWTDSDSNGVYDMHTNETGDLEPEIWSGRLHASSITWGNEDELFINYFDKNHRFRIGNLTLPRRALAYIDNEFDYAVENVNSSLGLIYGNETIIVTDSNVTTYKNRLNDTLGYEWLHLVAHGNHMQHSFDNGKIFVSDILDIDPQVFFYTIMACRTAYYTLSDYIGASYLFADTYGLLVVGSTKLHHIWDVKDFYEPIAEGKCIGEALKEWLEKNGELNPFTAYGMTILGDPTLRAPRIYNQTRDVAVTSVIVSASEVYSGWNVTINVTSKNEGIFVETFNITVYYDDNIIKRQTVNLFPKADRTLIFIWNTIGVSGNYTISAYAIPVSEETDTADNTFVDGKICVRKICGDVNGNCVVGPMDFGDVGKMYLIYSGLITGPPGLLERGDINGNCVVGPMDFGDVGKMYLIYSGIVL